MTGPTQLSGPQEMHHIFLCLMSVTVTRQMMIRWITTHPLYSLCTPSVHPLYTLCTTSLCLTTLNQLLLQVLGALLNQENLNRFNIQKLKVI